MHPDCGILYAFYEEERVMDWTTPSICEVAVGMEVTSYLSAEV
jgi:coenzyme PQQ precursor peptide PqqA